jgi:hypothetical protein
MTVNGQRYLDLLKQDCGLKSETWQLVVNTDINRMALRVITRMNV